MADIVGSVRCNSLLRLSGIPVKPQLNASKRNECRERQLVERLSLPLGIARRLMRRRLAKAKKVVDNVRRLAYNIIVR